MPQRHLSVVLIVVGTIAFIGLVYMLTLAVCCLRHIQPPEALLAAMKDVGLVAIGALTGLLARTATGATEGDPSTPVKGVNPTTDPVHTDAPPCAGIGTP